MSRKTKLTAWLVLGIILALGPILGTLPTAIGMVMTFRNLDEGGRQAEIFDRSIEIGTWSTLAGFAACPVGLAIVVISAMKLGRNSDRRLCISEIQPMGRMQFSLRMLFAAVAAVGIGAALLVAGPSWYMGAVEFLLIPCVLASAAMITQCSTGTAKAFWIGFAAECIWPVLVYLPVIIFFSLNDVMDKGVEVPPFLIDFLGWFPLVLIAMSANFRPILLAWAFAPLVGLFCVFTHWLLIRPPQGPKD